MACRSHAIDARFPQFLRLLDGVQVYFHTALDNFDRVRSIHDAHVLEVRERRVVPLNQARVPEEHDGARRPPAVGRVDGDDPA